MYSNTESLLPLPFSALEKMLRKSATNHPNSSDHVIVFNYFLTETFPRNPLSVHHLNLPIGEGLRGPLTLIK